MKKKVKKIPKYSNGTPYSTAEIDAIANQMKEQMGLLRTSGGQSSTVGGGGTGGGSNYDSPWKNMDTNQKISTGIETLGAAGNLLNTAMSGQDVTVGGAISATALGAAAGAKFGGPIGAIVGAGVGLAAGTAGRKRGVDYTTGTADMGSGWMKMFGPSKDHVLYKANMAQNSIQSRQQTENLLADYYNENPTGSINVMAAEGGIMRRPVNALVSKGELIYDPTTLKLRQVPGSKNKPNKADDVYTRLYEGDVVISNSPTMIMSNGKTPAQNLEDLVDYDKNIKAKEAIIKKVVNWQEANKTKPQEYAAYEEGTKNVTYDPLRANDLSMLNKDLERLMPSIDVKITGNDPLKNITKDQRLALRKAVNEINGKKKGNWLSALSDHAPLASALLKKPSYHKEQAYINPVKYVPTGVSIDPIRKSTDEGMAIARYNQMNVNPSTGAGMAAGLQAAVNRSKSIADVYKWQQDTQNKLIAQNAGIYNEWATREAQARHTANTETQQNEAAAMMMRDQAIKDAYEFQTGRRNDRWKLSMLEPMFKYAVDDNIWKKFII